MAESASRRSSPGSSRRLGRGSDFDDVFHNGASARDHLVTVRLVRSPLDITRWGFVVGRRVAPSAVIRNRTRRRLRGAASTASPPFPADILVIARKPALIARPDALSDSISRLLARAAERLR